jgi:hypothetical protein
MEYFPDIRPVGIGSLRLAYIMIYDRSYCMSSSTFYLLQSIVYSIVLFYHFPSVYS